MMEWQPIETAPKDGTKILVFCKPDEIFTATWGKWTDAYGNDWKETECWCVYDCEDAFYSHLLRGDRVTHWQSLPALPKEDKK
ncbi:MAG: DUF551 domain-containing protein [Acinetobacter sp.]|nr:DUF551 domain-containing protein [Acinetobacter sp.]